MKVIRISKDGVATQPQVVADGRVGEAAVSMDVNGGYYVAWLKHWIASDPEESVQVRAFDADGTARGPRFKATSAVGTVKDNNFGGVFYDQHRDGDPARRRCRFRASVPRNSLSAR